MNDFDVAFLQFTLTHEVCNSNVVVCNSNKNEKLLFASQHFINAISLTAKEEAVITIKSAAIYKSTKDLLRGSPPPVNVRQVN